MEFENNLSFEAFTSEEDNIPVIEGYGYEDNGDIRIVSDMYDDMYSIMESIYEMDMAEVSYVHDVNAINKHHSGDDAMLMEAQTSFKDKAVNAAKGGWEKLKAMVMKIIGKVKSFFNSMVKFLSDHTASNKKLAEQYKSSTAMGEATGYKYDLYKISTNVASEAKGILTQVTNSGLRGAGSLKNACANSTAEDIKKQSATLKENRESILNDIRTRISMSAGSVSASDFKTQTMRLLRGGQSSPTTIRMKVSDAAKDLGDEKIGKNITEAIKGAKGEFEKLLNEISSFSGSLSKEKDADAAALALSSSFVSLCNQALGAYLSGLTYLRAAYAERNGMLRKIILNGQGASAKKTEETK